jgi:hypothetical protein
VRRLQGHEFSAADSKRMGLGQNVLNFYFRPKSIERWKDGRIYEFLGVGMFRKVVVGFGHFFRLENIKGNNYFICDTSTEGLRAFEKKTRRNEAMHFPVTILLTYWIFVALAEGRYATIYVGAFVWFFNAYPAMLQRYNRVRIENVICRVKSRRATVVARE